MRIIFALILLFAMRADEGEGFADVVIAHRGVTYARITSLRLSQKLSLKRGDLLIKDRNANVVVQKVVEVLGGGGTVYFASDIPLSSDITLPYPSHFRFIGRYRGVGGVKLGKGRFICNANASHQQHSTFQLEYIRTNLILKGFHNVLMKFFGGEYSLEECNGGMKLIEFSRNYGIDKPGLRTNSDFLTLIHYRSFSASRFHRGGLLIGGHTAATRGERGGITTYPLPEKERRFYPTTVIGATTEGQDAMFNANGACLVIVGWSVAPGARKKFLETDGGTVLFVGENLKR